MISQLVSDQVLRMVINRCKVTIPQVGGETVSLRGGGEEISQLVSDKVLRMVTNRCKVTIPQVGGETVSLRGQ